MIGGAEKSVARRSRRVVIERPQGASRRWQRHGEVLPRRPVRVIELLRETADAVTLVLECTDGKPLPFHAGQYLTHHFVIDGTTHKRAYSLSSAEGGQIACTIKGIPGGLVSAYVRQHLKPGDRYTVLGPSGEFTLTQGDDPLVFIAAGSGITPVMSMLETSLMRQPDRAVHLLYANRSAQDSIFAERLRRLTQHYPALRITWHYSGNEGRLDAAGISTWASTLSVATFYLCGPAGFMEAAQRGLRLLQVPAERIKREVFLAASRSTRVLPTEPQRVRFQRSNREIEARPGESLLEAALRESVPVPFSCTVGGCGSCRVKVLEGDCALNEPNCLSPEERAQGYTLACSAYAMQPLLIDL